MPNLHQYLPKKGRKSALYECVVGRKRKIRIFAHQSKFQGKIVQSPCMESPVILFHFQAVLNACNTTLK